jgi:hypothetical protein
VTRTGNDKSIEVVLLDHAVEVDVSAIVSRRSTQCNDQGLREGLASITSPVTQQTWLDVLLLQWLLEKRVLLEVEHTEAKVQGGVKVAGELVDFIFAQWLASDGRASLVVDRPLGLAVGERALGHLGRHCTDCECSFSLFW